jgi:hypothetical protein
MDGRRPSTNKKKGLEASTKWRTSARVAFGDSETQLFGDAEAPPTTEATLRVYVTKSSSTDSRTRNRINRKLSQLRGAGVTMLPRCDTT